MTEHKLQLIPQTIADGWEAECSCGWHKFRSFYEINDRDALLKRLREDYNEHAAPPRS